MKAVTSMYGITCPTGSHLPLLERALVELPEGSLVLEHGAGIYSTPLLARFPIRVLCVESDKRWQEWAAWMYRDKAHPIHEARTKGAIPLLGDVAVALIDGVASERGSLLSACISANVPVIIAHDTEEVGWAMYGYGAEHFAASRYSVLHHERGHRTTEWRLR